MGDCILSDTTETKQFRATLAVNVVTMLLVVLSAVMNWLAYEDREQLFAQMNDLVQRVQVIEATQQTKPQLPQQALQ